MKKWSLKVKLTLLYTLLMTLVTMTALGIMLSLSSQEILSSVQTSLREQVHESPREITPLPDRLDIDSDFFDLEGGIYLSVCGEDGTFLYGRIPYGFDSTEPLRDGQMRSLRASGSRWYVYDARYDLEPFGTVYIRGVTSASEAESRTQVTLRFAAVLLPLLTFVTALVGYRMTRRALLPVRKITETVQKIQADEDLSRRVNLGGGKDEIFSLARTFDGLLDRLDSAFRREKQFTSDVSHELRTPLTVVLNQCDALLEETDLTRKERDEILVIRRKSSDMARMISQLLLLSRADQGRQPLNPERISLSELTEIVAEEHRELARSAGMTLTSQIRPGITAEVDETLYIRMLSNLLSNAVAYGKAGGQIRVSLLQEGRQAVGIVEDDGIGISPEDLPHIFERFYRADTSRSDSHHSGLGLSMAEWIAKAHGGSIYAESTPGRGSRFTFRIPLP